MKQTNVRLPQPTIDRINDLAKQYGSQAKVIIAAVELLHEKDTVMKSNIVVPIPTDIDYYGEGANSTTVDEYDAFVQKQGYETVRVPYLQPNCDQNLIDALWQLYCTS